MANQSLSQDLLHELFEYKDGNLYWKVSRKGVKPSKLAGTKHVSGHFQIEINHKIYRAHRLIFLMFYGYLPEMVDHIDGNPSNNKIENLRAANNSTNQFNAKTRSTNLLGIKGIGFDKRRNRYRARIKVNGKELFCRYYKELEDAKNAIAIARDLYHGEFARHN